MKVVKWITGASRGRSKSLIPSTIITLAIVAMLILSGPAQAVSVMIMGLEEEYTQGSDVEFQVKIDLNENDKYVPLTNISLDLTGNVSKRAVFDLNGKKISGNCNIEMEPVSVPNPNDFGYGNGYGYDAGYGYDFGNGYGYGYGYGGGGGKISYIYNVSIETACLSEGKYTVVATLNTDQNIAFHSSSFEFELKPGNKLNADVEIKPETLNRASKGTFTAFITSEEFDVKEIIGDSIRITCDGCDSAHAVKWNEANNKFIAKFKTQDLHDVDTGDSVKFIVTGKLENGDEFEGSDAIRVIESGKKEDDEEDDDECECDDDEDVKEHDDECDDDHVTDHDDNEDVKEHDDDKNVNVHKPEKNKDDNKKNSNNNGGKGKNVVVNNIDIHDNTGPVTVNIYNSNGNNGGKNKK